MTPELLLERLRENLPRLPGAAKAAASRESALARFAAAGYPTRKLEDWRYTDIAPLAGGDFELFPGPQAERADAAELLAAAGLDDGAAALLFADGALLADRATRRLGGGVELMTLADSVERLGPAAIASEPRGWPLAALNAAFASHGARLRVAPDTACDEPIHLVLGAHAAARQALQPQLAIELGERARATVVVHFLGGADTGSWTNLLTTIELGAESTLELRRAQRYDAGQFHTELLDAAVGADANLKLTSIDLGGRLVRNDLRIRLQSPGASCDLAGIVLSAHGQHIDNHVAVEHLAAHTLSEQSFRSIVGEKGRAVFNGKVVVHEGTKGISADQSSDNLLLADSGEIDTKPELEIHADDVKCSHGATVGEIDESELFYLRTRGIDDATARGLLTLAFANDILERAKMSALGAAVAAKFGLNLPDEPDWRPES